MSEMAAVDRRRLQSIFAPIVERLGYEVKRHEAPLDDLLRQVAVKQAASGGEPRLVFLRAKCACKVLMSDSVVAELTKSFERAQETGNEKHISPGLVGTVYTTVCPSALQSARSLMMPSGRPIRRTEIVPRNERHIGKQSRSECSEPLPVSHPW
jgi:hypothetical protein